MSPLILIALSLGISIVVCSIARRLSRRLGLLPKYKWPFRLAIIYYGLIICFALAYAWLPGRFYQPYLAHEAGFRGDTYQITRAIQRVIAAQLCPSHITARVLRGWTIACSEVLLNDTSATSTSLLFTVSLQEVSNPYSYQSTYPPIRVELQNVSQSELDSGGPILASIAPQPGHIQASIPGTKDLEPADLFALPTNGKCSSPAAFNQAMLCLPVSTYDQILHYELEASGDPYYGVDHEDDFST